MRGVGAGSGWCLAPSPAACGGSRFSGSVPDTIQSY
jgi:hypothetical protein